MSVQDALWLTMDRPNNLMIIDGVLILAEKSSYKAVLDVVRARVANRFPVFRRTPVQSDAGWEWTEDPAFDVARHVTAVSLAEPADLPALQRFMSTERGKPLPMTRPLWAVFVVDEVLLDDGSVGSAIVCRFHHAMADGVRLTQVMISMCDSTEGTVEAKVSRGPARAVSLPEPLLPLTLPPSVAIPVGDAIGSVLDSTRTIGDAVTGVALNSGRSVLGAVDAVLRAAADPIRTVSGLPGSIAAAPRRVRQLIQSGAQVVDGGLGLASRPGRLVDALQLLGSEQNRAVNDVASVTKLLLSGSEPTVWSGPPGTAKAMAWSAPMSLATVKAVSRSHGATVNDVLLAAIAGGVQRYLEGRDAPVREIQWLVPVNLKPFADNLPAELGNYFALVMLPMPLDTSDPAERIGRMRSEMLRIKHSDEAVLTFGLQRFMSISPDEVQFALTNFFANKAVGVLTNVPGPRGLLRFAGRPVAQIVGFAPCSGDQPLTATIFSYNGTVTVGFASDADLVPDPERLVEFVAQEARAMGALLVGGRPAGDQVAGSSIKPADDSPALPSGHPDTKTGTGS